MKHFDTVNIDPELNRVRIAYHEAGHAVAAWKLKLPIARTVSTDAESHAEWAAVAIQPDSPEAAMHRAAAIVSLAGECAQMFWDPNCFTYGCEQDRAAARYHADSAGEDFRRLEHVAAYLVEVEWPRIRALATAVLQSDAVAPEEARRIIERRSSRTTIGARPHICRERG